MNLTICICFLLYWTGLNWYMGYLGRVTCNLQFNQQLRGYYPNLYCALKEIFRPFLQVIGCRESISPFKRSISISAFLLVSPLIKILYTQWSRLCKCSPKFYYLLPKFLVNIERSKILDKLSFLINSVSKSDLI